MIRSPSLSRIRAAILGILIASVFYACGNKSFNLGKDYLAKGHYDSAIEQLKSAEMAHPDNSEIKRELGVAYYKNRQFDFAIQKLREAARIAPKDGRTLVYLGLTLEAQDKLDKATPIYDYCASLNIENDLKTELRARVRDLKKRQLRAQIAQRIASVNRGEPLGISSDGVAVLYFRNLSNWDELTPILKGVAALMTDGLKGISGIQVVDRLNVQITLEEMDLTPADFFDNLATQKAGKLLGATHLISGGVERLSDTALRLNAGVVNARTGALMGKGYEGQGNISEIVELTRKMLLKLIDDLGASPRDAQYQALLRSVTNNSLAFIAFSKGLDYEDRELMAQARYQYNRALELDPNFVMPRERLAHLPEKRLSIAEMERLISSHIETSGKAFSEAFALGTSLYP